MYIYDHNLSGAQPLRIVCGPIVRRTSSTSASLWVELNQDCAVVARANPLSGPVSGARKQPAKPPRRRSNAHLTVKVGGRFYALLTIPNLAPGWLYSYGLSYFPIEGKRNPLPRLLDPDAGSWYEAELEPFAMSGKRPTFRAFPTENTEDIRIAFGSCRRFGGGFHGGKGVRGEDVLSLFGQRLRATVNERLTTWPHLLLLLGDQIYADDVDSRVASARLRAPGRGAKALGSLDAPESILKWARDRTPGDTKYLFRHHLFGKDRYFGKVDVPDYAGSGQFQCLEFEDFAALYVASWTEPHVARMLANLSTFMIFDDHDISNDWNLTGGWIKQMKQAPGWIKAVTEGLVAYWMYQGWGNPAPPGTLDDRWKILESAAQNGTDALEKLQQWFESRIRFGRIPCYYEIEISPRILVLDTRNDRQFVAPKPRGPNNVTAHADYDDQILSDEQWKWLRGRIDKEGPLILASGVPLLQLPCADVLLMRGARSELPLIRRFEEQSQENADILEFYRRKIGTDQWTAFPKSFVKLTQELFGRGPFVFLSGDVHYSYGMYGRAFFPENCKLGRNPLILHAVSSPLRSQWTEAELKNNNPEFCHLDGPSEEIMRNMRRGYESIIERQKALKPSAPCDPSNLLSDFMRVYLPDALPVFGHGPNKMKWTHLNNIGILQVSKDGRSVAVRWLGASPKPGEALREIGSIASPKDGFVR